MNAVPFDTLKMARKLEASGMSGTMAAGTAEALAEAMAGADLATKKDLDNVRVALKSDLDNVQVALKSDVDKAQVALKSDIENLRTLVKFDLASLRTDMEILRRDLTIKVGGMMVVSVGILLAAIRYLPLHP